MRMIRSFFFGSIAVLAAMFSMSAHASAYDVDKAVVSMNFAIQDYDVPDVFNVEVITVGISAFPDRCTNSHAVEYIIQNQPHSYFRMAVDTYQHIDPHIGLKL